MVPREQGSVLPRKGLVLVAVRSARVAAPARCHCRGQRLLDEVGLRLPAVVPVGDGGPDTAPVPRPGRLPQPGPNRPARANPGGVPRTNRPSRGPGGPTGPRPTGPGRHRAGGRTTTVVTSKPRPAPTRPDLELPRHWTVDFEVLDGVNAGKVKLSSPQARGWSKVIRPFPDAVKEAITEARLYVAEQGHALWRGVRTELDICTAQDDPDAAPAVNIPTLGEVKAKADLRWQQTFSQHSEVRPDQDALTQWTLLPPKANGAPGGWQSKTGRVWRKPPKDTLNKIRRAGLPTTWDEYLAQQSGAMRSAAG